MTGLGHRERRFPRPLLFCLGIAGCMLLLRGLLAVLPCPALTAFRLRENSTRFYDRNGVLLQVRPLADGLRREYYPLEQLPQELVRNFVAAEDRNFYRHAGVDFFSIVRAALQNRKEGRVVSGASTITMQLVRLIYPRQGRVTLGMKFVEMLRAFRLEAKLSKKQILELYLNNIPFGFQVEGVGSASRSFFGREPDRLSVEEMHALALIPRRPSQYAPAKAFSYPSLCPHTVNYVAADYASRRERLPDELHLSIDSALNEATERQIQRKLEEFKEARIHNGAACAVSNRTGEVLVWVGNASFDDDEHGGQIDGVVVRNQPGSSMKPFLYALALERGFAPASVLPDIQQDFGGSGVYVPLNFNRRYNGPVLMRMALASSLNIPAVYLLYRLGMDEYLAALDALGFASLREQRESLGLSLALGSGEVTLLEMVRAFSVFPNDGLLLSPTLLAARSADAQAERPRVYGADTARILCDMLSDKAARAMGFGHAAVFDTDYPCIFKTGTSNQFQNIIALGATSEYTVGVWMGNFGGDTVVGETGSSIPAQIVRGLLDELTRASGAAPFARPEGYDRREVCALSGMAPAADCPAVTYEYVRRQEDGEAEEDFSGNPCTWHYTEGGLVKIRYPSEYQHWAYSRNFSGSISVGGSPLRITFPRDNAVFIYDPSLPPQVQVVGVKAVGGSDASATLYLDGERVGGADGVFSWNVPLVRGEHVLAVRCGGETAEITFTVK